CGACHGAQAEGNQSLGAPPLAGQSPSYLLRQLDHFNKGIRGSPGDTEGQQMRQILRALPAAGDWHAVIAYVQTLSAVRKPFSHGQSRGHGQEVYRLCSSCHSDQAQGNETLEAPALAILPQWYLIAQLKKFRTGIRGRAEEDAAGARMRAASLALESDADVKDVAAYIATRLRH